MSTTKQLLEQAMKNLDEKEVIHHFGNKATLSLTDYQDGGKYGIEVCILKMDERFRSTGNYINNHCYKGFYIYSQIQPDIRPNRINLWGTAGHWDKSPVLIQFSTITERTEYKHRLIEALADWCVNWSGFAEEKTIVHHFTDKATVSFSTYITPKGYALNMQVLSMDERFRRVCKDSKSSAYTCKSNGFKVFSNVNPCLSPTHKAVSLRGRDKDEDYEVAVWYFPNDKKRQKYLKNVIEALGSWALDWPGFNNFEDWQEFIFSDKATVKFCRTFEQGKHCLKMQVIKVHPLWMENWQLPKSFKADNGFNINFGLTVDMGKDYVSIRQEFHPCENPVRVLYFDSEQERNKYWVDVRSALHDWENSWFEKEEPAKPKAPNFWVQSSDPLVCEIVQRILFGFGIEWDGNPGKYLSIAPYNVGYCVQRSDYIKLGWRWIETDSKASEWGMKKVTLDWLLDYAAKQGVELDKTPLKNSILYPL